MRLLVTPTFQRAVKKLHKQQKAALDEAVRAIASQPEVGETKVGDLAGVQIYKFRMDNLLCLIAYRLLEEDTLKLTVCRAFFGRRQQPLKAQHQNRRSVGRADQTKTIGPIHAQAIDVAYLGMRQAATSWALNSGL
jgi:mRNA interferase RelE/StbE